jgi:SAM-dependent methyltransferase
LDRDTEVVSEILSYEDLRGSTGRRAFFRPQRYDAAEIFPTPPPRVTLGDDVWRINDISLSGIAVTSKDAQDTEVSVGESLPISINQMGVSLFDGRATVMRIEPSGFGSKLALRFDENFVDVPALRKKDAQARLRGQFASLQPTSNDAVSKEYRVLCSDILSTFRSYRSFLDQRNDDLDNAKNDNSGAFELCLEQMMPQWRELWLRGNEATEAVMDDKERLNALKTLTELVLTPEFNHGPIWERSYSKPLGYPGDFQVMNYVYDWKREGESTYGQIIHRLGLDVAECIGTRMDVVIDTVLRIAKMKPAGETARILSLGSGPAREVKQIYEQTSRGTAKFEYTLVDQEEQALQYAYEGNYPAAMAHGAGASINCLNLSFTDILRGNLEDKNAYNQDMVYSVGLFDYLKDRRARALAKSLFDLVKPGGLLVLGNMNKCELSNLWPMECLTDWRLYYRGDAEMLGWAEALDKQNAWTELEPTGRVRLLFVRKAGGDGSSVIGGE